MCFRRRICDQLLHNGGSPFQESNILMTVLGTPLRLRSAWSHQSIGYNTNINTYSLRCYSSRQGAASGRRDLPQNIQYGVYGENLPGGIQAIMRWWRRLKPLKQELADLRRRLRRNKRGFDVSVLYIPPFAPQFDTNFPVLMFYPGLLID